MPGLEEKKKRDNSESPEKKSSVLRQKLEDKEKLKPRTHVSEKGKQHSRNNKRWKGLE